MRIRKNLVRASSESVTQLCQLNQSPWDVPTAFSSSTTASPFFQVQQNESFLQDKALQRYDNGAVHYEEQEKEADNINYCAKTDENGNWICGLEAKQGETFCEFHLQSYIVPLVHPVTKTSTTSKKSKSESNPYKSLYYYDGFGPTWGKRRVARELSKKSEDIVTMQLPPDFQDSEVEEEDDLQEIEFKNVADNGKKRVRKRIKARSLKSLM